MRTVLKFIAIKRKNKSVVKLLKFASQPRFIEKDFVFNRDECYEK